MVKVYKQDWAEIAWKELEFYIEDLQGEMRYEHLHVENSRFDDEDFKEFNRIVRQLRELMTRCDVISAEERSVE